MQKPKIVQEISPYENIDMKDMPSYLAENGTF